MDSNNFLKGLLYAGSGSMLADVLTLPIDVTKTRLQLAAGKYKGAVDCVQSTVRKEGVAALWKGLEPALWRQATYGSMRYGLYSPIKEKLAPGVAKRDLPLYKKILAGALSGGISGAICNPCDVVKVRMMADGMGATAGRSAAEAAGPRYNYFLPAFAKIASSEGLSGL